MWESSPTVFLHSRDLVFLALWQPHMHDVPTSGHCRAECISEGLADYLARFSGQHTNYSGMMRRCILTPVSRRVHNLAAPHRWSLKPLQTAWGDFSTCSSCCMCIWFSEATIQISILFQGVQKLWSKVSALGCRKMKQAAASNCWTAAFNCSVQLLRPGRKKERGLLGTFHS